MKPHKNLMKLTGTYIAITHPYYMQELGPSISFLSPSILKACSVSISIEGFPAILYDLFYRAFLGPPTSMRSIFASSHRAEW